MVWRSSSQAWTLGTARCLCWSGPAAGAADGVDGAGETVCAAVWTRALTGGRTEKPPASTELSPACARTFRGVMNTVTSAPRLRLDPVCQLAHLVVDRAPLRHQRPDLAVCVHDCRVVPPAELLADLGQGQLGELPAQ